jgi:uncharacterized membrane protein (DUF4010 family)
LDELHLTLRFAAALGLGLFLGLERERDKPEQLRFAGVRTFGLIALCGALSGYIDVSLERPWISLALFGAVSALVVVSYVMTTRGGNVGATTEFAALVTFLLGVLCLHDKLLLAASIGVATGAVLSLREQLHALARKISTEDVEATVKFAVLVLIVLPLVPNRTFGPPPWDALNPFKICLMIVLISAVDFASYVLVKVLGPEHGIGVSGLLGGLVSSTALTLGLARRSKSEPSAAGALALGILLAWSVMYVRVIAITGVLAPALLSRIAIGQGIPALAALGTAAVMWRKHHADKTGTVEAGANPFVLTQAIRFGLLFALVILAAKAAQTWLGTSGLYATGALAGSVDVDAITIPMTGLAKTQSADLEAIAHTIEVAALSNTLVKAGFAYALGSAELRRSIVPVALILIAACVAGFVIS